MCEGLVFDLSKKTWQWNALCSGLFAEEDPELKGGVNSKGDDRGQRQYEGNWSNNRNKCYPVQKDEPSLKKQRSWAKAQWKQSALETLSALLSSRRAHCAIRYWLLGVCFILLPSSHLTRNHQGERSQFPINVSGVRITSRDLLHGYACTQVKWQPVNLQIKALF